MSPCLQYCCLNYSFEKPVAVVFFFSGTCMTSLGNICRLVSALLASECRRVTAGVTTNSKITHTSDVKTQIV